MTILLYRWLPWLTFWVVTALPAAAEVPYSGVVVFGTSLSDPGNAFALRAELYGLPQNTPPMNTPASFYGDALLIPSAPYARGGLQVSNGAPWIVPLARQLGLLGSVQPAFASASPIATNYAIDRARARNDGVNLNLADQYAEFDRDFGGIAPPDRLYVIEMGSNDINDALRALQAGNPAAAGMILQQAAASIGLTLQALHTAGARHLLILNAPNLARTPAVIMLGAQAQQAAIVLSNTFNVLLDGAVSTLPQDQYTHVMRLNIYGILEDIATNPAAYGFTDWTHACITPDVPPYTCQNPDEYVFWDGTHPTKVVHAIVAEQAYEALGL